MIAYLFGGVKTYDKGLLNITSLVNSTMQELGMGIKELNLGPPATIPFYDGVRSSQVQEIIENIRAASGVIFATTAGISGASAVLHTFLEHLEQERDILKDKNCMIIVMSNKGDYHVVDYLSRYISNLGGYDSVRMLLDQAFFERGANQAIAEKQIEDFYRMVKAKRKFYRPHASASTPAMDQPTDPVRPYNFPSEPQPFVPAPSQADRAQHILQNYEALNNQGAVYTPSGNPYPQPNPVAYQPQPSQLAPTHQEDIEDIANFFQKKINPAASPPSNQQNYAPPHRPNEPIFSTSQDFSPTLNPSLPNSPANQWFANEAVNIGQKTPRQLTASLIHHYQPHVAGDLACVLQMEVSGPNGFSGYITINGAHCTYQDGQTSNPSLTVLSDETNWTQVITGKMSAQKAFMTGNLKIKGNFVLLTRFDQIFNTSKNY